MPLNINDNDELKEPGKIPPSPITRKPLENGTFFTKKTVTILIAAVVVAGLFLMYKYDLIYLSMLPGKKSAQPEVQASLQDTPQKTSSMPESSALASTEEKLGQVHPPSTGKYTIYISAYKSRLDAEEEAARWSAAGFSSFVYKASGWHRVALGRYKHLNEAKAEAERLKQSFEYGYWIGSLD